MLYSPNFYHCMFVGIYLWLRLMLNGVTIKNLNDILYVTHCARNWLYTTMQL